MDLQVKLALQGDLEGLARKAHLDLARGARNAVEIQAARAKLRLRQDTRPALGQRVANAWRADIYPRSASVHTHTPAVLVYSNAPKIVEAFSEAQTIHAKNATYLAIPTEKTPHKGRKLATPKEVEAMFDQDLIFIHGRGQQILAFIDPTKRGRLKRARAKGRSVGGVETRFDRLVLMFVMVRQVGLKKRLNWKSIFADLDRGWGDLFQSEINAALAD
jgi:hypothetical protein